MAYLAIPRKEETGNGTDILKQIKAGCRTNLAGQTLMRRREPGQIAIRLLCRILSSRAPNEVGTCEHKLECVLKAGLPLNTML